MAKAAEKLSKKDIATNDGIAEALLPLAEGLQSNWKTILPAAGAALALALIVVIVLEVQDHHKEQAAQSVGDALALVDRPVVPDVAADEKGADAKADKAKSPKLDPKAKADKKAKPEAKADDEKPFATEKEKQEAILKSAQATIAEYGSQPAGRVALLTTADAEYQLGKYAEAIDSYQKFVAATPDTDYLKTFGELGLAWAQLGAGKGDDAIATAKGLAEHPPSGFGKDLALLAQGHIAENLGKLDVAKQAYKQLRTEAAESPSGREAGERLTFLGEPPPAPVAPTVAPVAPTPAPNP